MDQKWVEKDIFVKDGALCPISLVEDRYGRVSIDSKKAGDGLMRCDPGWLASSNSHYSDTRTPTEKDRDRILYGRSFLRLSGITQVLSPDGRRNSFHTRITHSYKVAQVARSIAFNFLRRSQSDLVLRDNLLSLGGLDVYACEAAGLAHDIGHPPFGHLGEQTIDRWMGDVSGGCFEGNAQTFRKLIRFDTKNGTDAGLELCAVTLAATAKYPWRKDLHEESRRNKYSSYPNENKSETNDFPYLDRCRRWFICNNKRLYRQTAEAAIMDIADDITYAMHDLQDFVSSGLINLDSLYVQLKTLRDNIDEKGAILTTNTPTMRAYSKQLSLLKTYNGECYDPDAFKDAINKVMKAFTFSTNELSLELRSSISGTIAQWIGDCIEKVQVDGSSDLKQRAEYDPTIHLSKETWHLVQLLKQVIRVNIIDTPQLQIYQRSQAKVLLDLLERLRIWTTEMNSAPNLPTNLKWLLQSEKVPIKEHDSYDDGLPLRRAVADYICSLSDAETTEMSNRLSGFITPRFFG
jgi:dGTPase